MDLLIFQASSIPAAKILNSTILLFSYIIFVTYSSCVTSKVSIEKIQSPFQTIEEFMKTRTHKLTVVQGSRQENRLESLKNNIIQ